MTLRLNGSGSCTRPDAVETEPYTYATPGQVAVLLFYRKLKRAQLRINKVPQLHGP